MVEDDLKRFQEFHDAIAFDLSFGPDMETYNNEPAFDERVLHRIKPKDPGLVRVWLYLVGLLLDRFPVNVEARPLTPDTTPQQVEDGRRAVESIVFDARRGYDDARRRLCGGAIAARAWGFRLGLGTDGNLIFDAEHPANITWAEGFLHPHHPENPRVMRRCRMRIERARALFRRPDLKPDGGTDREDTSYEGDSRNTSRPAMRRGSTEFVTIAYVYSRFEFKAPARPKAMQALEPEMWHMACPDCGYTSPPQAEAMMSYPEQEACPECGGMAKRIEAVPPKNPENRYTGGKRLVICAPFSQGDEEPPLYDGDWEFDYDYFPLDLLVCYPPPHKPIGQSITSILKTPLLAKNALIRLSYETLIRSKPYFVMPPSGAVTNVYGTPFAFQPSDGDVMLYGGSPGDIQIIQGQGVNQSVFALMDRLDSVFRTNEGTSEVALTPSQLKETKVGTLEQYTESGNVRVDDHGKLLYALESRQFSNVACALRELPSRQVRYQAADGTWQFIRHGGPGMPPIEILVGAGNVLHKLDLDELRAYTALLQMPPEARMGYAALSHTDPSVLMKLPFVPNGAGAGPGAPPAPPQIPAEMMNGASNG